MQVKLIIDRFNPNYDRASYKQEFSIEAFENDPVLEILLKAREQDPGLSFRRSCRSAICGSCAVLINGEPRLACQTLLKEVLNAEQQVILEPLPGFKRIKDLVVDMEPYFDSLKNILPWVLTGTKHDGTMSPEDASKIESPATCILCGICDAKLEKNSELTPAAIVKNRRLAYDTRDVLGPARLQLERNYPEKMESFCKKLKDICPKKINLH